MWKILSIFASLKLVTWSAIVWAQPCEPTVIEGGLLREEIGGYTCTAKKISKDIVSMWVYRFPPPLARIDGRKTYPSKYLYEFDCTKRSMRAIKTPSGDPDEEEAEWSAPHPQSTGGKWYRLACSQRAYL